MYSDIIVMGNHTFAVIRGNEEYSLLKNGLAPVLHEINDLVEAKVIDMNGELVELTIYLGGDYKVIIYWLTYNV